MADVLRLANEGQTSTVNLLAGTLKLRDGTWATRTAPVEGGYNHVPFGAQANFSHFGLVVELMDLVSDSGASGIRTGMDSIEDMLENARRFHRDPFIFDSQWLEWNQDGETAKRSLLYEGSLRLLNMPGVSPMMEDGKSLVRMAATRHPFWEAITATNITSGFKDNWGGMWTVSSIPGSHPARLEHTRLRPNTTTTSQLVRGWVGIREARDGIGSFDPVWECESTGISGGHARYHYTDVSDVSAGSTESNAYYASCDFSSSTSLVERIGLLLTDAPGDPSYYPGSYLVLARCKVTAGTIGLQARYGLWNSDAFIPNEEQFISHTSWRLIPLGTVKFPPVNVDMAVTYCEIQLWAEQISGSGNLHLDAIQLIPSEHLLSFEDGKLIYSGGVSYGVGWNCDERDAFAGYGWSAIPDNMVQVEAQDWYLPVGNSMVVFAAERESSHVMTDELEVWFDYVPRWRLFRV